MSMLPIGAWFSLPFCWGRVEKLEVSSGGSGVSIAPLLALNDEVGGEVGAWPLLDRIGSLRDVARSVCRF